MSNVVVIFKSGKVSKFTLKEVIPPEKVDSKLGIVELFKENEEGKKVFLKTPDNEIIQIDLTDVSMIQIENI